MLTTTALRRPACGGAGALRIGAGRQHCASGQQRFPSSAAALLRSRSASGEGAPALAGRAGQLLLLQRRMVAATAAARVSRRSEYDEEALREAAAALAQDADRTLTAEERRLIEQETARSAMLEASHQRTTTAAAAAGRARAREVEAPAVEEGEGVGHLKVHKGEEFVLREVQPGQLAYLRVLRPGVTPLMAFGERRGSKRKRFTYKGHVSPYYRISAKSPLWKLVVPEKDLVEEGRRARMEWERDMWPKSKRRPRTGGETV